MRNRHARADAGADLFLARLEGIQHFLLLLGGKLPGGDQVSDEFDDGGPVLHRLHVEEDVVCAKQLR